MKTQNFLLSALAAASVSSASAATLIDISANFNGDVFATSASDNAGLGFGEFGGDRAEDYKFRTDVAASPSFPTSGGTFTAANSGPEFQLGAYDANNAIMITGQNSVTIDIANQVITELYALHSAVFAGAQSGTFKFTYTDTTFSSDLTWNFLDSGASGTVATPVALTGSIDNLNGTQFFSGRNMFWSTFVNPNQGKIVDSITFSSVGQTDTDADFAVLAVTAIPEPSTSVALLGLAAFGLLHRRRSN